MRARIGEVIVGQEELVFGLLVALFGGGHVLVEGVPGLGKTLVARSLAQASGAAFKRIQFTPDLMPSDVTGSSIYDRQSGTFAFVPGPIFTNLLLADEVNRAPAKTQSALLEAMQEHQVTVDGHSRALPPPFLVIATQNPIESQGTYPLPEAQLDRFLLKLNVESPPREVEERIVKHHAQGFDPKDISSLAPASSPEEIARLQRVVGAVRVDDAIVSYMVELVRRTRDDRAIELGASPRASIAMLKAARVVAASEGRTFVTPDDIKPMVKPILRHRVMLHPDAELQGLSADDRIDAIVKATPVPRGKG
ncbi:MAG: MoxR family ATPase [Myxococcales bacterium]|nr:MoxR family ATPase [Myxococcales bacterium]